MLTAIDLIATGPDELSDYIILFDAARIEGERIGEVFTAFADPGEPLPLIVSKRYNISQADIDGRPSCAQVAKEFLRFIGDDPVLVYGIQREMSILSMRTKGAMTNDVIDVEEFARIVLPTLDSFRIERVAQRLSVEMPDKGGCARAVAEIWLRLCREARELSVAVLTQINELLKESVHPLRPVFAEAARHAVRQAYGKGRVRIEDIFRDYGKLISRKQEREAPPDMALLDPDEICANFEPGGVFSKMLSGYEHRAEQIEMARAVTEAFNDSLCLMVEAGTGTGKSMAYLVPAAYWAAQNGRPVIVSTNTKNLQSQLYFKDIPFLQEVLDVGFKAAIIKGRTNYLCVRKFLYLMREAGRELDDDEIAALLPVITWAELTETGDLSENTGFFAERWPSLRERLTCSSDECLGRACKRFRYCFVRKARAIALGSDVIVANHAVVFSELGMDNPVLPEYDRIIFDEAHNIENVATDFMSVRINRWSVIQILRRLYRGRRDGTGRGLLTNIRFQLSRASGQVSQRVADWINDQVTRMITEIEKTSDATQAFFNAVGGLVAGTRGQEKIRYDAENKPSEYWDNVEELKKELVVCVGKLAKSLDDMAEALGEITDNIEYGREFCRETRALSDRIRQLIADIEFVVEGKESNFVYWVETAFRREPSYELCAAPLDISGLMAEQVYGKNRTVVLCSATLTVGSRSDFVAQRIGVQAIERERVRTLDVGTPFDFDKQALFCVPSFLPDPGRDAEFAGELGHFLAELLKASGGRGMVLFTSYAMLNEVYPVLKNKLEPEGILVLGQGKDGPRESIMAAFQRITSSVLLGTQSFWEGVDVVGESLSVLAIAKLPFHVFTEPIIKARCELMESRGMDSFMGYMVPSAIIRLRQGVGRLIRTRADRGVVILGDKRLLTRRYGRAFLRSLPTQWRAYSAKETLVKHVYRFLNE